MGPSGRGKSTLLHLLGALDRPTSGDVTLRGQPFASLGEKQRAILRRREIGFVFQAFNLIGNLTVADNIELPALLAGSSRAEARQRRAQLLDELGIGAKAGVVPAQLSGGQRQRVAIARALVNHPSVLLADEPTGNLDSASTREVLELLQRSHAAGQTIVMVMHDPNVAAVAQRVVTMRDGQIVDDRGVSPRFHRSEPSRPSTKVDDNGGGTAESPCRLAGLSPASPVIFVIIAAAAVTLTLSLLIRQSTDDPWNRAFNAANGPHVVYYAASDVDLRRVASIDGVTQVSAVFPTYGESSLVRANGKYDLALFGLGPELPTVNRPLLMQGQWLQQGGSDQIVLEQSFARELGLHVGDRVNIATPSGVNSLRVTGVAVTLGRGPYPDWSIAVSWVLPETLTRLVPDRSLLSNGIAVRVENPDASASYASKVNALFPNQQVYGNDDWHEVKSAYNRWNQIASVFFGVFSVFAVLAVAFIIANAIGGRVLAQYREIGLMKAIGFIPRQVTTIFLLQHLLLGLMGAIAGIGIGTLLAPYFLDHTASLLGAPVTASFDPVLSLEILTGLILLIVLFTLLPAWRGSRISTIQAITTGFSPAQSRPSWPARLAMLLRLPLVVSVGIKDAFSRPARALFTIAALATTVITITFALGTEAMIEQLVSNPALNGEPFDMVVSRDGMSDEQTRVILAEHPEIVAQHSRGEIEAQVLNVPGADGPVSFQTRAFGGDYQSFPYAIGEGRMLAAPDEAIAAVGLLKLLHVNVGQDLTVMIAGQPATFHLVGRVVENDDDGQILIVTEAALKAIDPGYVPSRYVLLLAKGTDGTTLQRTLLEQSNYGLTVAVRQTGTPSAVSTMRTVLFGLSAALLVIGLANLLTTSLLNVRERSREVGVFKAIGMTPGQIVLSVISGVSLLALIAVAIGIPLGIYVYHVIFRVVGEQGLNADPLLFARPHTWWLVLLVPSAVALSALASALPAWRAASVDVVEVLRAE